MGCAVPGRAPRGVWGPHLPSHTPPAPTSLYLQPQRPVGRHPCDPVPRTSTLPWDCTAVPKCPDMTRQLLTWQELGWINKASHSRSVYHHAPGQWCQQETYHLELPERRGQRSSNRRLLESVTWGGADVPAGGPSTCGPTGLLTTALGQNTLPRSPVLTASPHSCHSTSGYREVTDWPEMNPQCRRLRPV